MENLHDVVSYAVSDFIAWEQRNELNLSPSYQRNPVWNEKAKSYLIDTILRGLVIPPVFLKQTFDIDKKITYKEVVDGQQRIRTILQFQDNTFKISKMHNEMYAGMYYDDLPDEAKTAFLSYRFPVEIIKTTNEGIIYDIFARLNSSGLSLTKQELRNAKYKGYFKNLAYKLAKEHKNIFISTKIFNANDLIRMNDVEFISKLLIVCIEKNLVNTSQNIIDKYYKKYEENFENVAEIEENFGYVVNVIEEYYKTYQEEDMKAKSIFLSKTGFYDVFLALYSVIYFLHLFKDTEDYHTNLEKRTKVLNGKIIEILLGFDLDYLLFKNTKKGEYYNSNLESIFETYYSAKIAHTNNLSNQKKRTQAISDYFKEVNKD